MLASLTRCLPAPTLVGIASLATTAACADLAPDPALGRAEAEVRNGTVVDPWAPGGLLHTRSIVHVGGCTGTALDRRWVLTAKHCGTTTTTTVTSDQPAGSVVRAIDRIATHPTLDVVLLHLTADLPASMPAASVYTGAKRATCRSRATTMAIGATTWPCGARRTAPGTSCAAPAARRRPRGVA